MVSCKGFCSRQKQSPEGILAKLLLSFIGVLCWSYKPSKCVEIIREALLITGEKICPWRKGNWEGKVLTGQGRVVPSQDADLTGLVWSSTISMFLKLPR